jgi:glycosyltransferase involved in cell wall biosynthesis
VIGLLSRAAVHVLPSVNEPFPMTVLEAMSVGTPVVVTNECGLADIVGRTGAGIACAPDATSLADALRVLLADPARRAEAGVAGRQAVEQTLAMSPVIDRLEDIYGQTIEHRRARGKVPSAVSTRGHSAAGR